MSQVIDTKVVEMQFDNSKFEKNIETSLNSLKFLNKSIDDAGKNRNSLDSLAKASDNVGVSFDNMNMKSKISINMFDMLAGVGTKAFNRISDAVAGFALNMANSLSGIQAMRDGFAEYELKMGSVQTMLVGAKIIDPKTAKTTKDEARRLEIINEELARLNDYSDKTIYSFKDMTSNIGKFTNNGVELHDAVQAIQGVANVAAAAGANSSEASRAMYNFSQALSSGAVKLIDWKSIENANMATQDFKQQLLDTALAMGTVTKSGKNYISTTTDLQGKVSDAFTKTKGFNDSLSHQWMTTDVLTQTLKNYSTDVRDMSDGALEDYRQSLLKIGYTSKQVDRIIENSRKAFEAATEVKTFTQMIDTLKESLGSGWAQTFEIVIGDFREAKALFTGLNNAIDNMLSPIGKARNAILQMWKDNGGRQALLNSFSNLYYAVLNLFEPLKKLWKAFTPNTEHTGKGLAKITKAFEKLTELIRKGALIVGKALAVILTPVISVGNFISKHLLKLVGVVRSGWTKISPYLRAAKKAVVDFKNVLGAAFSKHITSRITSLRDTIAKTFDDIKKRFKESATIQKLVQAFHALKLEVQDLFWRVVSHATTYANHFSLYLGKIWKALSPLVSSAITSVLKSLAGFILPKLQRAISFVTNKLSELGNWLSKIDIRNTSFYKGLASLPDKIADLSENQTLKNFFTGIKNFGSEALTFLSDKFTSLKTHIEAIKMPHGLKDLFDNIRSFIKGIFGEDSVKDDLSKTLEDAVASTDKVANEDSGEKLTAFQKFLEGVSDAFDWLKTAADKAKDALSEFVDFVKTNTPKAMRAFYDFLAGDDGVLTMSDITDAIYLVSNAFSELLTSFGIAGMGKASKNFSEAVGKFADAAVTFSKRIGNKWNMEAMRDFAIGVGILVGALWVLSKIPADKLAVATTALIGLGYALSKFFGMISSGKANITETAGFIPIAILLVAISGAMIAIAASVGILVGVLAIFPSVIKQYNNLGKDFRKGMDRVKEVLVEIFEYLDHTASSKYSFRSAMALLGLVAALGMLRKTIVKFANKKTGKAMEEGLNRISQVLGMLGSFLTSIQLGSFNFINVGIDLDTVGMAAMILAMGFMIDKITPSIEKMARLKKDEFKMAFKMLELIFFEFGAFLAGAGAVSYFSKAKLGEWLGIAATVTLLASAVSSCVSSIKVLAGLAAGNPDGLKAAMTALCEIFFSLGAVLAIIGMMKPKGSLIGIFGVTLAVGMLTACVVALYPLANSHPEALQSAVIAVGGLMLALGGTLLMVGKASGKTTIMDIVKLIGVTSAMLILTNAIRRLARTGGDSDSIKAAGLAIGGAALAIAGAMRLINGVVINPLALVGLGLLALAIWGVAFAISAFKQSSGDMVEGAAKVSEGTDKMTESVEKVADNLRSNGLFDQLKELIGDAFGDIGNNIKETLGNIDLSSAIRNMINTVKADAVNWAQDFIDIGTNIIDGVSTALENPANIEKVKSSMKALGQAILDAFKSFFGIASPSTVMAEQGGFMLDGLVQGLMEYPSKLADWLSGLGEYILEGINGFVTGALEKGQNLVHALGKGLQNGRNFVSKKAAAVGKFALDKVGRVKEWGSKAIQSASSFGSKLAASKNPVAKGAGLMVLGATGAVQRTTSFFQKVSSDASSKFSSTLRAGKGPAAAAGAAIVTGAKSAFNGITSSFMAFGQNAAQGFRNGLNSLISSIAAKAAELVRRAKEAAKAEQHSNSPSKDFMEYGGWAAEGYALGLANRKNSRLIETNAKKMVDAAKGVASSTSFGSGSLYLDSNPAMRSLAFAMGQISDSLDENMNTSPTIRPVIDMSNVNHNASAISALFGDKNIGASVAVMNSIQNDFDKTMTNRANAYSLKSIDKLANRINAMTDTMNSRSMNNYITVDGAADPTAFADELVRSFRLNARTV